MTVKGQDSLQFMLIIICCSAALLIVNSWTQARIENNRHDTQRIALEALLTNISYDNDLLAEPLQRDQMTIYRVRHHNETVALLLETVAPQGYNGPIRLLIGVDLAGNLLGVRTLHHQETPGLGDKMLLSKSRWILQFDHRNLANSHWQVKKEGGDFDSWTGATITPRAIVQAVAKTLRFVARHHDTLYS